MLHARSLGSDLVGRGIREIAQHLPADGGIALEQPLDHVHRRRLDRSIAHRPRSVRRTGPGVLAWSARPVRCEDRRTVSPTCRHRYVALAVRGASAPSGQPKSTRLMIDVPRLPSWFWGTNSYLAAVNAMLNWSAGPRSDVTPPTGTNRSPRSQVPFEERRWSARPSRRCMGGAEICPVAQAANRMVTRLALAVNWTSSGRRLPDRWGSLLAPREGFDRIQSRACRRGVALDVRDLEEGVEGHLDQFPSVVKSRTKTAVPSPPRSEDVAGRRSAAAPRYRPVPPTRHRWLR